MTTQENEARRTAIRGTLARHSEAIPDATAVAEAALRAWRGVVAVLEPVIGVQGVAVLFARSLLITGRAYPCLAIAGEPGEGATLFALVKARTEACEGPVALEASHALLVTFTELLSTLIGESLAGRLLGPVWESQAPESNLEMTP
jgi:hypothetical protein